MRRRQRACFTDNGVLGASVRVEGSPDVPCGAEAKASIDRLFCVPRHPPSTSVVASAAGLPGLGRLRLPVTVEYLP